MSMKSFHLGDILSVTTGFLLSPSKMDGLYQILDYMTGDQLFTHQLPRASRECAPALLAQHPALADIQAPESFAGPEDAEAFLMVQVARFGEYLDVQPLCPEEHTQIDPIAELKMMAPHVEVIPVEIPSAAE